MSEAIRKLEPSVLWNYFADLNAVPRPSKKEEKVIAFIKNFGESLNLPTLVDEAGNVIIRKPATKGMENRATVVLQSHLDMVHQKNSDTSFDFSTQGIEMYTDGDWVKAKGTTLGADNGIGVAAIMSVLASNDMAHPAIEALFMIDEETGMTGALSLKGGLLSGKFLLNLDTEEDNELTIGCAGGIDVTASGSYEQVSTSHDSGMKISVKGLTGGHSGTDIHKGRANANKLMNRILFELKMKAGISVAEIDGGSLRNAIPRESSCTIGLGKNKVKDVKDILHALSEVFKGEYGFTDPNITIEFAEVSAPKNVLPDSFATDLIHAVYACPNGIYRMSPSIEGLVQTSNNVARVLVKDGTFTVMCLTRSSVNSEKTDLSQAITCAFATTGAKIKSGGAYPGWEPKPDSEIVKLMTSIYKKRFNETPHVNAVHAGLECGILGTNYPKMEMISFGPNIYGAHSPDEKAQISSVQKFWGFFKDVLENIPQA